MKSFCFRVNDCYCIRQIESLTIVKWFLNKFTT